MLTSGAALSATKVAVVGGTVQLALASAPVTPEASGGSRLRGSTMAVHAGASRDVSVYRLKSNGTMCRVSCGEMPMPLAGHVSCADSDGRLWTFGGYSSAQMAPQCLCRVTFSEEPCQSTEAAADEDGMSPQDSSSTCNGGTTRQPGLKPELRPVSVDVFNADSVCVFGCAAVVNDAAVGVSNVWIIWGGMTTACGSIRLAYTNVVRAFALSGESPRVEQVRQTGAVPSPRAGAAMTVVGGALVLAGGRGSSGALNDVFVGAVSRDLEDGEIEIHWIQVKCAASFPPRTGHAIVHAPDTNSLLIVGGSSAPAGNDGKWQQCHDVWIADAASVCGPRLSLSADTGLQALTCSFRPTALQLEIATAGSMCYLGTDFGLAVVAQPYDAQSSDSSSMHSHRHALITSKKTRFIRWGSAELCPTSGDVTPPQERDPNIRFIAHFRSTAPVSVVLQREGLTITDVKKHIMKACGVPRGTDPNNFLMDFVDNSGSLRPLHLPDVLHAVLMSDQENVMVHAVIEEPPKSFQTVFSNPIGKGTFGTVYRAINQADNTSFCLKRVKVDQQSASALDALQAEIRMMRQLRHDNLVKYLGSQMAGDKVYIFMELVPGDTLERLCRSITMTNRQIQLIVKQVLLALEFLHSYNVVHRDIKGANVLFDAQGVVKVSDFGTAKHLNPLSSSGSNRPAGTILYMAPEIMRGEVCHTAADVWSLGCLIIEMAAGQHPFHERNFSDGIQVINAVGVEKYKPRVPDRLSPSGRDFVQRCLSFDPSDRPTATDLLQHDFITRVEPEDSNTQLSQVTPSPQTTAVFQADTLAETDLRPAGDSAAPGCSLKTGKPKKVHPRPKP